MIRGTGATGTHGSLEGVSHSQTIGLVARIRASRLNSRFIMVTLAALAPRRVGYFERELKCRKMYATDVKIFRLPREKPMLLRTEVDLTFGANSGKTKHFG